MELENICQFAQEKNLDVRRLREMWTAYCFHRDLEVDTNEYDNGLITLWGAVVDNESCPWPYNESGFNEFDLYMCEEVV